MSKKSGHLYEKRLIEKKIEVRSRPRRALLGRAYERRHTLARARAARERPTTRATAATGPAQETGECPVTKQPLSRDDLLPVKTNQARAAAGAPAARAEAQMRPSNPNCANVRLPRR